MANLYLTNMFKDIVAYVEANYNTYLQEFIDGDYPELKTVKKWGQGMKDPFSQTVFSCGWHIPGNIIIDELAPDADTVEFPFDWLFTVKYSDPNADLITTLGLLYIDAFKNMIDNEPDFGGIVDQALLQGGEFAPPFALGKDIGLSSLRVMFTRVTID